MKNLDKKTFNAGSLRVDNIIKLSLFMMLVLCLIFVVACDNGQGGRRQSREYTVGEQYSQEQGDFIMSRVEASCGITVGETVNDGYYLLVYGQMEMVSFTLGAGDFCTFEDLNTFDYDDGELLMANIELSEALSEAELHVNQLRGEASHGNYCLVFDMTETVYNKLYARKDITTDPENYGYDLEMSINCLNYAYNSSLCMAEFKIGAEDIEFI